MIRQWFSERLATPLQKWAFGFLLVFGVVVVTFGFASVRNRILFPAPPVAAEDVTLPTEESIANELKSRDTDNDTLTDFDELNVYHTSPYLADSDSDSQSDPDEIKTGTNPNCPEGKTCNEPYTVPSTGNKLKGLDAGAEVGASGAVDATSLRALLKAQGVSESVLSGIPDAALLKLYAETVAEAQASPTSTAQSIADNLSISEIRTLLVQFGLPESDVKKLSDEEVMRFWKQLVAEALKQQ